MDNAWQRYLETASGLTATTRQRAERVVKNLVKQGEVAADQVERTVEELLKRSDTNRKAVASIVRTETERAVERLGLARQRDVDRLAAKVAKLEGSATGTATATETAAKKSAAAKRSATPRKASAAPAAGTAAPAGGTAKTTSGGTAASPPPAGSSAVSKTAGTAKKATGS